MKSWASSATDVVAFRDEVLNASTYTDEEIQVRTLGLDKLIETLVNQEHFLTAAAQEIADIEDAMVEDVTEAQPAAAAPLTEEIDLSLTKQEVDFLFNDVLRLFELGDLDGGLISVGRLLIFDPKHKKFQKFIKVNGEKLEEAFASELEAPGAVPIQEMEDVIPIFEATTKIQDIYKLVDGTRTIGDIVQLSKYSPIETFAILNHLYRGKYIKLGV